MSKTLFYHIGNCVIRRMNSQVRIANLQRMRSILFCFVGNSEFLYIMLFDYYRKIFDTTIIICYNLTFTVLEKKSNDINV